MIFCFHTGLEDELNEPGKDINFEKTFWRFQKRTKENCVNKIIDYMKGKIS
jgi:hypothetical protein